MDYKYLYNGIANAKKPLLLVSARISPQRHSGLYSQWQQICLTMSEKVRDIVVKRLFEQGYTIDDIKVTPFVVSIMKN